MGKTTIGRMTEGKPLSLILRFAFPLLLGNLFQQTYNMVDAAIVGQTLGADALGSIPQRTGAAHQRKGRAARRGVQKHADTGF